ncbi:head GIN domain-containing protein [Pedobacter gandavensis]|uniref:head GIN domain-containing protein n=1 Tax=Pedobacter gandavensis TaxID=2679963 RepID=UPI00292F7EFB|nr:head GIN domain-containing protein [Pedobacter gandavensis]
MKKLSLLLSFALLSFGLYSQANAAIRISATHLSDEERKVSGFTGIAVGGSLKVLVKLGNTESLRLEGDQEAIDQLITEVKDGTLSIRPKKAEWKEWFKKYGNTKVTAYITAKKLTSLAMSGSGSIEVEQPITANSFDMALSGSGSIKATVNAQKVDASLSGSGSIKATVNAQNFDAATSGSGGMTIIGKAKKADIAVSGSGGFSGRAFTAEEVDAHVSGSGSVYIDVQKRLDAATSGSGSVNYTGNPTVSKAASGSGKVRKAN